MCMATKAPSSTPDFHKTTETRWTFCTPGISTTLILNGCAWPWSTRWTVSCHPVRTTSTSSARTSHGAEKSTHRESSVSRIHIASINPLFVYICTLDSFCSTFFLIFCVCSSFLLFSLLYFIVFLLDTQLSPMWKEISMPLTSYWQITCMCKANSVCVYITSCSWQTLVWFAPSG